LHLVIQKSTAKKLKTVNLKINGNKEIKTLYLTSKIGHELARVTKSCFSDRENATP
jgi:hypothetical protein